MVINPAKRHGEPHALRVDPELCTGCVICTKACPTKAIRVRNGLAEIQYDRCVACGECYRVCPHGAVEPVRTPWESVVRFPHPVAAPHPALFSQFGYDTTPNQIMLALKRIGFEHVVDTAWLAELTAAAMEDYIRAHPELRPAISPTCPAVVRLITKQFPSLVPNILPMLPPQILAAKAIKTRLAKRRGWHVDDIGVFIVSPCSAIRPTVEDPIAVRHAYVDGIICLPEIFGLLLRALKTLDEDELIQKTSGVGIAWPKTGGQARAVDVKHTLAASGFSEVLAILEMLESGRLTELRFVEMQICPGSCLGGPLTVENRYRAASVNEHLMRRYGLQPRVNREKVRQMAAEGTFDSEQEFKPRPLPPLAPDPRHALEIKLAIRDITRRLPMIECAVCGSPDCYTFAEDVVLGKSNLAKCPFVAYRAVDTPVVGRTQSMTLQEIVDALGLKVITGQENLGRTVKAGYISDMLSDVMARVPEGGLWMTVQTHQNVAAVAVLKDLAAVCLVGGREPSPDTLQKAADEGLPILQSDLDAFTLAGKLHALGLGAEN